MTARAWKLVDDAAARLDKSRGANPDGMEEVRGSNPLSSTINSL